MVRKFLIGPEPREVAAVRAEGTPYGIAIDRQRERLWVTLTATNQSGRVLDRRGTPLRIFTYPTIRQPNTVAVDPSDGDVFVGSRSDAQISADLAGWRAEPDEDRARHFPAEPPPGTDPSRILEEPAARAVAELASSARCCCPSSLSVRSPDSFQQVAYGDNSFLSGGRARIQPDSFRLADRLGLLYALTQGLHVTSGVIAIPLLIAKLWSVMPKLFEWPPVRSLSHLLERLSLALLVGGALFVFFTGLMNIQLYYPWNFSFVPSHYYAAFVFLAALALHVGLKYTTVRRSFREQGVLRPLKYGLGKTVPEPYVEDSTTALEPAVPTVSRRMMLGTVGAASIGLGLMMVGQTTFGEAFRRVALLAPRGRVYGDGPNDFQVNKTAESRNVTAAMTGPDWRLRLQGGESVALSREQLLAMPQYTYDLPIACVEGWSTTQTWTGVRLRDLASAGRRAGCRRRVGQVAAGSRIVQRGEAELVAGRGREEPARATGKRR